MRTTILRKKDGIFGGLISGVLAFTLFMMMSFPAWAHDQQKQSSHSPTLVSLTDVSTPSGNAVLQWNRQTKVLRVTFHLSGLQPGSNHAAHIHTGTCSTEGKIVYPFKNVVADRAGNATSMSFFNNVTGGIPATGWHITVHRGPTAQTGDLLCGNVVNPKMATMVSVFLHAHSM